MKMRKKAIAVLLAFAVALALAPVVPAKAEPAQQDTTVRITLYYGENHEETFGGDNLKEAIEETNNINGNSVTINNFSSGSADSLSFDIKDNSGDITVGDVKRSLLSAKVKMKLFEKYNCLEETNYEYNYQYKMDNEELFSGVALKSMGQYKELEKADINAVWAAEENEDTKKINEIEGNSLDFHVLWADQPISSISMRVLLSVGLGSFDRCSQIGVSGNCSINNNSVQWYNNYYDINYNNPYDVPGFGIRYRMGASLIPNLGYYFVSGCTVRVEGADLDNSAQYPCCEYKQQGYSGLDVRVKNIIAGFNSESHPAPVTPSYIAPTTVSESTPMPLSTPMPKTVIDVVDPPSLYGTFPYGTDVRSKLPTEVTLRLADGSTDVAQISWLQKSVSRSKEIYTGSLTLPPGVADPFEKISPYFDYEATITHKDIISIDNDGRPLTAVADFSEKDKVADTYLPKTLTAHIDDGTTYDIVPSWTLVSQTETELKYETAINSAALLVDGIENPRQIGKVEFTVTLMDKPKGKFDLREYGGEFAVPYSNSFHVVQLKTNDKGEITFSSDDKEVVTVKNKAGYGYDDNCIITLIKPGTTTVRAYIDGIEVDSMEVVVNKLDQDLKVTYKG
ncbi:MAG: hypothetical protein IJS24_09870, partial [Eubacterium sp.]|nr:hypothetical protein [Eubacterium sp.]